MLATRREDMPLTPRPSAIVHRAPEDDNMNGKTKRQRSVIYQSVIAAGAQTGKKSGGVGLCRATAGQQRFARDEKKKRSHK